MLPKFMTTFKAELQEETKQVMKIRKKKLNHNQKRNCSNHSCSEAEETTGLRLITQITNSQYTKPNTNVVLKFPNILTKLGNYHTNNKNNNTCCSSTTDAASLELSFLKACNLCNKKLRHDKDIYMYRGDQGFCSVECRKRQIVMDEMKEAEGRFRNCSYKQRVSSSSSSASSNYRNCWNDARQETRLILEDLRLHRLQSNNPIPNSDHHHQNHWAIVS